MIEFLFDLMRCNTLLLLSTFRGGNKKLIPSARAAVVNKPADDLESFFLCIKLPLHFALSSPAGI